MNFFELGISDYPAGVGRLQRADALRWGCLGRVALRWAVAGRLGVLFVVLDYGYNKRE